MAKSTHHHPAAKRGPKSSAAHKARARARMDARAESILRGREIILTLVTHPAMRRDFKVTRPTKVANALRRAFG